MMLLYPVSSDTFNKKLYKKKGAVVKGCLYIQALLTHSTRQSIVVKGVDIDWLQSLKQFFINVSYHILVASLTLMALF